MLLGSELGRYVLGELPGTNAEASGSVLTVTVTLIAGQAVGEAQVNRVAGVGPGFRKVTVKNAFAFGATITAGTGIVAGRAHGEHVKAPEPAPVSLPAEASPDVVPVDAQAFGASFALPVSMTRGVARGDANAKGSVLDHRDWTKYDNRLFELEIL